MSTPAQMFDRRLNPVKGWPSPYALDKALEMTEGEYIKAGMVMHIDPVTGKFRRGLPGKQIPVFAWNAEGDFDAAGVDDGNISNYGNKKGLSGLVGLGPYEVESTEFVSGENYPPNLPLRVNNIGDDKGKVQPGEFYTETVVGVVSDGQLTNAHNKDVVRFWTYFLPATGSEPTSSSSA